MGRLSTCVAIIFGCALAAYAQLPPMLEQLMANPTMAMAMMNGGGQGSGPVNPLLMSAMMNPTSSGERSSSFNDMAMMNMMMNGASGTGSMFDQSQSSNGLNNTSAGRGMQMPPAPVSRGPNINDIMSMMMLSNSGGSPSSDTLQRIGVMGALGRGNTRVLNPNLSPNQLMDLTRDGVGVSAVLARQICPPQRCPFRVPCESPIITYKPETFFVCPDCPKCPFQIMMGAMNPNFNSMGSTGRRPTMRRNLRSRQRTGAPVPMRAFQIGTGNSTRTA
ncbi:uncharacterized protein LOC132562734 [Ylistrum balloti]|uniref:uncharacterized protein LOC132562734 n=1 Tax=Ylistrum balloti TaxID=509963 RepID=UPI002905E575|nr:uncharacterized protein LOC132562734 [Ylistrum balloti]